MVRRMIWIWTVVASGGWFLTSAQTNSLYKAERMGFSSAAYDEFCPVFVRGKAQLIFVSNRSTGGIFKHTSENGMPLYNYFYVSRKKDSSFTASPRILANELVSGSNKGPFVMNKEGTKMYLTKNVIEPGRFRNYLGANNLLGIFESSYVNGRWTDPVLIPAINIDGYNTCHPALSPDGKRLYFASDRPGGYGRMDLWYSDFVKGQWTPPRNLGPVINTTANEVYPGCTSDGRLYFSSNSTDRTSGKLDIFFTEYLNDTWIQPVRLGEPFNSQYNDFGFMAEDSPNRGFFCSDRNDRTTSDVYYFYITEPEFSSVEPLRTPRLCYTFYENNGILIDTTFVMYEWSFSDGQKQEGLEVYHCFQGPGDYVVELNVIEKAARKINYNQATYNFSIKKIEQPWISCSDSVLINEWVNFSGEESYFVSFIPEKYYWDFGDGNKAIGISVRHRYLRPGKYRVRLGVTGKFTEGTTPGSFASYKEVIVKSDDTLQPGRK